MAYFFFLTIFILPSLHVRLLTIHDKFRRYNKWDGYKCHEGYSLFQMDKRVSILDCARHCSGVPDCTGIFYQKNTLKCMGCSSQCDITNATDISLGSSFYVRDVCPTDDLDWVPLPRGCSMIQFPAQSVSQQEAETICGSVNAKLVKIDERWKMDFITDLIQTCDDLRTGEYWVDGSNINAVDYLAPDAWSFSDGSLVPMDSYFWAPHAPNSPETHHCFRIVDGLWDDKDCSFTYRFICEK